MSEIDRRDFLKLMGVGAGSAASTGCYRAAELPEKLIPYVVQPEEITPGLPVTYASTCQECSAGCGLHVRTREARPIKLEGNPQHPVNRGALCARGQSSIGRTFHPDRHRGPRKRAEDGSLSEIAWDDAVAELASKIDAARGRVAVLGGPTGPTLSDLIDQWLAAIGGGSRVVYEPFAQESLRAATEAVFGVASRPIFDLSGTDFVVDFGADSLGTWVAPVEHARQLMEARDASTTAGRDARLVYVGPRLDETASSADEWLPAVPGTEGVLALGIANVALGSARGIDAGQKALLSGIVRPFSPAKVASTTGVDAATITRIGKAMARAKRPAALPPGTALTSRRATATQAAVLVLNAVVGAIGSAVRIPAADTTRVDGFRDVVKLIDAMKSGDVAVLLVHDSNPLYSLPKDAGFAEALENVDYVVSFASMPDETSAHADLILPDHTPLESWGDSAPRSGVRSVVQPTIRPLFDTQSMGDTLLATARASLARGGVFRATVDRGNLPVQASAARLQFKEPQLEGDGSYVLVAVPSPLLGDGSGANLAWLQETPDPITKIAWQSWVEISTATANDLGVGVGDVLKIETTFGSIDVPAWPRGGLRDDVVVVALGQGHTVGLYASLENDGTPGGARGVNVNDVLPALTDESGGRAFLAAKASVSKTGDYQRLPFTQATDNKRGRLLGESISLVALAKGENPFGANEEEIHAAALGTPPGHGDDHAEGHGEGHAAAAAHDGGHHEGPHEMRRGFDPADDSTEDSPYRWGMTVDVDKCTGCSACVVACSIENNISVVGEEGVLRSRQMSWLRIERYVGAGFQELDVGRPGPKNHEELGNTDVRNSPMMCQQCGAAPCEPVCPVIATYHTEAGLNGMVYNRCIPEPMPLMLNPDVTVRGQGVMEKCTFCIQRIQSGRLSAKEEGRLAGDGDIQTACQQTCPTGAIVFGNVKDDGSAASKAADANAGRAYHALHVLNTRPSITYLAAVERGEEAAHHASAEAPRDEGERSEMEKLA
jgi:molybdopterin-containing oxidoreductase family iron-sulfur binding subunit